MGKAATLDRALGALYGVAIGDAMGMPSQTMDRHAIRAAYGMIDGFVAARPDQPVSAGLPAGTITDDMEQTLLLARHLIDHGGRIDDHAWARTLTDWEADTRRRGVNDLLGPSTKRAIEALIGGMPVERTGLTGTTNGAAMRIVPVGILCPSGDVARLTATVAETSRLTHNTGEAIGAAAAVAAVVSAGIDGMDVDSALPQAIEAARIGERLGQARGSASMAARIGEALALARGRTGAAAADAIADVIGTSVQAIEAVPMAFAILVLAKGNPWQAAILAANIGDDTDTIGAIACGMAGACTGASGFDPAHLDLVTRVNRLDLAPVAEGLLALRAHAAADGLREVRR